MKLDIRRAVLAFILTLLGFGFILTFKDRIEIVDFLWMTSIGLPKLGGNLIKAISMYIFGYAVADIYYR